ncbi:dehydrodolichyl diphosphate synthase 6 [Manihot esculenta]|uniref:Uncharacterized protein n=2 Tax=Manihot esculenta TaxID=3983 RepID=A0ACB7G196_MANES|nr:dehydrodolichyl diphosphate synthase 6 [Manihot esculenta]XP_043808274.1 dehydrodolichyl diphosphate synthase 6 [Manihot esculenta]KAG8634039.1 hypothetical protein MANES_17G004100v8 [Manihot esculenta]OAY24297.1 hypothetical protein MANES_17G004100v8 [Manihot esculenta]
MGKGSRLSEMFGNLGSFLRICIFRVLSMGPIPNHFAFIMDGNRRYAKKKNMKEGAGHRAGFLALISLLKYCYELGVKYVTVYAFSIDNFKRSPDEVKDLMNLLLEKIEELLRDESIVNQYGVRVYFIGNLKLLIEPVRIAAEKVMKATANNTNYTLLICIAYTSLDEIVHAVQVSCKNVTSSCIATGVEEDGNKNKNNMTLRAVQGSYVDTWYNYQAMKENRMGNGASASKESGDMQGECSIIKLVDIEKHMYMAVAPKPDILIRSSGETRLSNFLLWQASECLLYSPDALWPEVGLWHLLWAVLNFQRNHSYLEKKRRQL